MYYIKKYCDGWAIHNDDTGHSRLLTEQEVQAVQQEFPQLADEKVRTVFFDFDEVWSIMKDETKKLFGEIQIPKEHSDMEVVLIPGVLKVYVGHLPGLMDRVYELLASDSRIPSEDFSALIHEVDSGIKAIKKIKCKLGTLFETYINVLQNIKAKLNHARPFLLEDSGLNSSDRIFLLPDDYEIWNCSPTNKDVGDAFIKHHIGYGLDREN